MSSVDDFVKVAKLEIGETTREIELNPTNPTAYLRRAVALRKLGDTQGEMDDCDKAVELNPNYVPAYLHRADAHDRSRKYELALAERFLPDCRERRKELNARTPWPGVR